MALSSPIFIFLFLPLVLLLYHLAGARWKNPLLLLSSIVFYIFGDISSLYILAILIVFNYFMGIYIGKHRDSIAGNRLLLAGILVNLLMLGFYKYDRFVVHALNVFLKHTPFAIPDIEWHPVPLGISFITFTAIAYLVDIHREESEPREKFLDCALFLSLFPKISAGPIVRYTDIADQVSGREVTIDRFAYGVRRFTVGLGKKILIADILGLTVDEIFRIPTHQLTAGVGWLGIIAYTLQIYFDFSGYTDMAIGIGHMFGFKFTENFDYPYISKSLTEFWRRWHITLSTWFRDYLFLPLNHALMTDRIRNKILKGQYKTNYRTLFSIFTVFTLCGLWHGAWKKYLVWGMLHGIIIAFESAWLSKKMSRWRAPLQHGYFLFVIMTTWVFFRSDSLTHAFRYLKAMFGLSIAPVTYYPASMFFKASFLLALSIGVIASLPVLSWAKGFARSEEYGRIRPALEAAGLAIIMILSIIFIASSTYNPFIYRQF